MNIFKRQPKVIEVDMSRLTVFDMNAEEVSRDEYMNWRSHAIFKQVFSDKRFRYQISITFKSQEYILIFNYGGSRD